MGLKRLIIFHFCSIKPTRTPSFNKNTTVTVQIKTNKNSSVVKRSASASSDHQKIATKIRNEKGVQTLPHRSRSNSETLRSSHNVSSVEEDLVIYRLPGEKLGLGLRFEGGSKAHELVQRLFVQCCSKGSPAARTRCTWGSLSDGDEIISISGKLVRRMTRVDCVKALKGKRKAKGSTPNFAFLQKERFFQTRFAGSRTRDLWILGSLT